MLTSLNVFLIVMAIASLIAFGFLLISSFKRSVLWGLAVLLVPFAALAYGIKYWHEVKKPFLVYTGTSAISLGMAAMIFMQMGGMQAIDMAQKIQDGTLSEQDAAQFMMTSMEGMQSLGIDGQTEILDQMRADPNLTTVQLQQAEKLFEQIEDVASGEQPSFSESADDMLARLRLNAEQTLQALPTVEPASSPLPILEYVESPIKAPAPHAIVKTLGPIMAAEAGDYLGKMMMVTANNGVPRKALLIDVKGGILEFQRNAFGGSLSFKLRPEEIQSLILI